jgi:hypothetical protein
MSVLDDYRQISDSPMNGLRRAVPLPLRKLLTYTLDFHKFLG